MENVILVPAKNPDSGRELLDSLGRLSQAGEIELRAAAIVERQADGRWHFPEETAQPSYRGTITGGAVGRRGGNHGRSMMQRQTLARPRVNRGARMCCQ